MRRSESRPMGSNGWYNWGVGPLLGLCFLGIVVFDLIGFKERMKGCAALFSEYKSMMVLYRFNNVPKARYDYTEYCIRENGVRIGDGERM